MTNSTIESFVSSFFKQSSRYADEFSDEFAVTLGQVSVAIRANLRDRIGSLTKNSLIPADSTSPSFSLEIWRTTNHIELPDLVWARDYLATDRVVAAELTYPYRVAFDKSQGFIYVYDTIKAHGAIWVASDDQISLNSFITPFRMMFSWMADGFDAEIVHASGIAHEGHGAVINGPSGSGKSTLALLSALNGLSMVADDVVLYDKGQMYAVYNYAKVDPRTSPLDISAYTTFQLEQTPIAKNILHLDNFGPRFVKKSPVSAVIFPIFAHINHFEKISPKIAINLLAPNSLRELMGGTPANFKRLLTMVRDIPAYRVAVSTNNDKNLDSVRRIFAEVS